MILCAVVGKESDEVRLVGLLLESGEDHLCSLNFATQ
jgi:hypothetical protein